MKNLRKSNAFTLIELSLVIVIIALLVTSVLVARLLIDSAKINKIHEDYRMFTATIQQFQTIYDCIPGDCTSSQLISSSFSSLNPLCIVSSSTGDIDTEIKRTCLFQELFLARMITDIDPTLRTTGVLGDSVAGQNIPHAKFSRSAAWDFIAQYADSAIYYSNPSSQVTLTPSLAGTHMLVLRDARIDTCPSGSACGAKKTNLAWANILMTTPISPLLSYKLDAKFDDGMPYTGIIVGDKVPYYMITNGVQSCNDAVNSLSGVGGSFTPTFTTKYIQSNNIVQGCQTAYMMPF